MYLYPAAHSFHLSESLDNAIFQYMRQTRVIIRLEILWKLLMSQSLFQEDNEVICTFLLGSENTHSLGDKILHGGLISLLLFVMVLNR